MKKKSRKIILDIVGILASLLVIIPFYMIVINSFKNKEEAAEMNLSLPSNWNIVSNYRQMFEQGNILTAFKNSILLTVICTFFIIILCAMMAFVLERRKSRFSSVATALILLGLAIPGQIIPTYFICNFFHLTSFAAASVVLITSNISFGVFLYLGYYKSISQEIDESAMIDGCGPFRLFFGIIFPMLKPVTVTLFIISYMNVWNDFGTTIYFLNSSENFTLTLTIYNFFSTHSADWNLVFANVVTISLPVIIVYFLAQKQIISGMTAGAVKG